MSGPIRLAVPEWDRNGGDLCRHSRRLEKVACRDKFRHAASVPDQPVAVADICRALLTFDREEAVPRRGEAAQAGSRAGRRGSQRHVAPPSSVIVRPSGLSRVADQARSRPGPRPKAASASCRSGRRQARQLATVTVVRPATSGQLGVKVVDEVLQVGILSRSPGPGRWPWPRALAGSGGACAACREASAFASPVVVRLPGGGRAQGDAPRQPDRREKRQSRRLTAIAAS